MPTMSNLLIRWVKSHAQSLCSQSSHRSFRALAIFSASFEGWEWGPPTLLFTGGEGMSLPLSA